jgi:hypothetical protein
MSVEGAKDERLVGFSEGVARLAKAEGRNSIMRIMNSFAKGHFRTRDDFLRVCQQSS